MEPSARRAQEALLGKATVVAGIAVVCGITAIDQPAIGFDARIQ